MLSIQNHKYIFMDIEAGTLAQSLQKCCCQVPFCPFPQHRTGRVLFQFSLSPLPWAITLSKEEEESSRGKNPGWNFLCCSAYAGEAWQDGMLWVCKYCSVSAPRLCRKLQCCGKLLGRSWPLLCHIWGFFWFFLQQLDYKKIMLCQNSLTLGKGCLMCWMPALCWFVCHKPSRNVMK